MGQDLVHGVPCSISMQEGQVPNDTNKAQDGVREDPSSRSRNLPCTAWSSHRDRLEKLVANLVPAVLGGDLFYLHMFLGTYRALATTQEVLDLLFQRYGCVLPYSDEDGGPLHQLKQAMSSILGTWLLQHPEDFHQPPEFPCLKMVLAYLELSMPGSDLEHQAHLLLAQLKLPETEGDGEEDAGTSSEQALETPGDVKPAAPLLPRTAPEPEQAQATALAQV